MTSPYYWPSPDKVAGAPSFPADIDSVHGAGAMLAQSLAQLLGNSGLTARQAMDALQSYLGTGAGGGAGAPGQLAMTGGGTITAAAITSAIAAGFAGFDLDPRYVWDATGLVIKNISNFRIRMGAIGSAGWTGGISYGPGGFIKTDTTATADGIQLFSDGTAETQGVIFENCVIVGANSKSVVHVGGRQRRCSFPGTFIYNTNATRTTVAAASNAVNTTTYAGAGVLTVASTAGFASSGYLVIATSTVMATLSYTGKTSTTFTGVGTLGGIGTLATGGTVGQGAFGLLDDTELNVANSENSDFPYMTIAGANCALGLGIGDQTQHANDSFFPALTTSAGLVAIVALTSSNMTFINFYDRSSPALCTTANHSGVLTFITGESLNGFATAPHDLVNSGATTVYISRTLTQTTSPNTMVIAGGRVFAYCRARWAGNIVISNSGGLYLADPGGSFTNLSITGTSGTLLLSGTYLAGAVLPDVTGWSGVTKTSQWA